MSVRRSVFSIVFAAVGCVLLSANAAVAQPSQPSAGASDADKDALIHTLRQRIAVLEKQVEDLQKQNAANGSDVAGRRVITFLESMYYGAKYYSSTRPKFFAARMLIVNLTRKPVTLNRENIQLVADGKSHKITDLPSSMRYSYFYIGQERHTLGELKVAKELIVKPGRTATTWVVFLNISKSHEIPKLRLKIQMAGRTSTIDVNDVAQDQLRMKVERIGPRKSLGLMTISGSLNSVNVGGLVDTIDDLTRQKVVRFVVRWSKSAPQFNSNIRSWLINEANRAGRKTNSSNSYPFPDIPATVRELHLAAIPNYSTSSSSSSASRIHKSDVDAVSAALKSAYAILPPDELIREIENGHPLTRAAALADGGGRLPTEKLPLLLKYADDENPKLQLAALEALRHFGEKEAIAKLTAYAQGKDDALAQQAVASLASSRFAASHRALLKILKDEPAASKKKIVKILADYPRPIWSETIYEFVKDPKSGVGPEALEALGIIGHPKLVEVLEAAVRDGNSAMQKQAFSQLVKRSDQRSEEIALDYTLAHLKTSPPTSAMYSLIKRTKDQRAVPLLLKHLDNSSSSRTTIIDTLAMIGDQSVGDKLVARYPKLKSDYERSHVLQALVKLRSPKFRKLAGEALMSKNSSLISAACDGLRQDAGPEAVKMLIDALHKATYSSAWSYTANSLAQIATPEARAALIKARESKNSTKRNYAISALKSLMQRSPGYQYIYRAKQSLKEKKIDEAIEHYSTALMLDDQLSVAYAGRGHAYLRQNKIKDAHQDFNKAAKMDPYDVDAITGIAIVLARQGKYEEAVKTVEENRKQFSSDRTFQYNAARVYSRALEAVRKAKNVADKEKIMSDYEGKALKDLKAVISKTRSYYSGPKPDDVVAEPDFDAIRNHPDYKKLIDPTGKKNGKPPKVLEKKEG